MSDSAYFPGLSGPGSDAESGPRAGLQLIPGSPEVYNSPPEAPKVNKSRPGGLQVAPRRPRRSTNSPREVYNSPPEAPKVNKSRPGGLQVAPRRPRRSANSPREVYNSPPEAPKVNKSRPGGLHIPPEGPGGPQVTPKRRHHPAPASQPPAWSHRRHRQHAMSPVTVRRFVCIKASSRSVARFLYSKSKKWKP